MKKAKISIYMGIILIAALWIKGAVSYGLWQGYGPGPGLLPLLLGIVAILLTGVILASSDGFKNTEEGPFILAEGKMRLFIVTALIVVSVYVMDIIGFFLSGALLCFTVLVFIEKWNKVKSTVVALIIPGIFMLLFEVAFKMPLPKGIWF